jgi:dicarboxylate transporter 10
MSLYNGISAALLRQATYSTVRFAFYESAKDHILSKQETEGNRYKNKKLTFVQSIVLAGIGGGLGSIFGSPADLINVRMQNDLKLPINQRRNYKNCFEALYRITKTEGFSSLYIGFHMATLRGILVTIGQLAFYDQFKSGLLNTNYFQDNVVTHFTASIMAGFIATSITQPADVILFN